MPTTISASVSIAKRIFAGYRLALSAVSMRPRAPVGGASGVRS